MLTDYKKHIKITKVDSSTGVLTYNLFYDTMAGDLLEEVTRIKDSLNIVNILPKVGDKVFFLNGVTIPRFKIKKFYEDTGAKGVKYINSANLLIIGKKTIQEHFDQTKLYRTDKEEIIKYMDNWILNNIGENNVWVHDLRVLIKEVDEDICVSGYYNKDRLFTYGVDIYGDHDYIEISTESYVKLDNILNLKCNIIDETVILKQLNNTTIMDEQTYNSIQFLMDSSDHENMKLAMELIANCDYDSSALCLLLLLKKYSNKIDKMHTKHHINFKAMLNYFDFTTNSNFNISIDQIIDKLKDKKVLFPSYKAILVPLILEDFNPNSNHYRISDVILMDEDGNDIVEDPIQDIKEIITEKIEEMLQEEVIKDHEGPDSTSTLPYELNEGYRNDIESVLFYPEEVEPIEVDPIVFDEMTEVIGYLMRLGFSYYRDIVLEVRDSGRSSEDLIEVIKFLDTCGSYEEETLIYQSYISLP